MALAGIAAAGVPASPMLTVEPGHQEYESTALQETTSLRTVILVAFKRAVSISLRDLSLRTWKTPTGWPMAPMALILLMSLRPQQLLPDQSTQR